MSEWMPLAEAIAVLRSCYSERESRILILERARAGLLKVRATRYKRKDQTKPAQYAEPLKTLYHEKSETSVRQWKFEDWMEGTYKNEVFDDVILQNYIFSDRFADSDGSWTRRNFVEEKFDWKLSEFFSVSISHFDLDDTYCLSERSCVGMEVESHIVRKLVSPNVEDKSPVRHRGTKYNWEAAFADVAAQFYQGRDFDDLEARGVQAEIQKMLLDSFAERGLEIPSPDSAKVKAKTILGALRSQR